MLKFFFYLCLILLSLGQLTTISKTGESSIYLFDLAVLIFSVLGVTIIPIIYKELYMPKYLVLFLLFSFLALSSLIFNMSGLNGYELLVSFFYLLRWVSYLLSGIIIFNMLKHKIINKDQLVISLVASGVFIALAGFIQLALLPDFEMLNPASGWDPHKNRLASTFFDPNFTGVYLVVILLVLFEFKDSVFHNRGVLLYSASIIISAALFLTFSRSSWGMAAVVILIYGLFKYKMLLLMALLVGFLAYFAVPRVQTRLSGTTDPADSAQFRLVSWSNTVKIAEDNMLLGVGFNAYRYAQNKYGFLTPDTLETHSGAGSDSSLLFVLATTGIPGFIVFIAAFMFPVLDSYINNKSTKWLIPVLVAGLMMHSMFVNSLFYPQVMFMWLTLFSLTSYLSHT
ncbi:MAG TPA: O-antigen ligase family protein [Patescibacteria group bacterium]|nr:O-antigen ligase family protein [Patescibacteria group bacterium]